MIPSKVPRQLGSGGGINPEGWGVSREGWGGLATPVKDDVSTENA